jgi:hypothetical protein
MEATVIQVDRLGGPEVMQLATRPMVPPELRNGALRGYLTHPEALIGPHAGL